MSNDHLTLISQVTEGQTFQVPGLKQVPGPIQQTSGNISSASSLLSFSEYNNSKYGFKIQYPSDWQVISIANDSLSSSSSFITGTPSDVIVRIGSPPDQQKGIQDLLTISAQNISAVSSSQQSNGNLTAYDYAATIMRQLPLLPRAADEGNQTNLIKNESVSIASESNGNNSNNLSAWRIDYIASDYKSELFVINDTKVFNIAFSTPKERATQSLPVFDKMLDSFQFLRTTTNATAAEGTLITTGIRNTTAINNQTTTTAATIPLQQQQQQQQQQTQPLLQPPFSSIPPPSQQQPLFQQPIPPQQPSTTIPPSTPLYPVPSIPPTGSGQTNNYPPPMILSQYSYINDTGSFHIVGEVLNQAPVTARFVKIIATFYNAFGQVIGTDFTYADPSNLAPGQMAPFDLIVPEGNVSMYQMSNYALNIDWRSTPNQGCDPSYPDVCISPPPPVLNCLNVFPDRNFRVIPPDPHGFDGDRDGIGCEA
jgi:hypothetical protein